MSYIRRYLVPALLLLPVFFVCGKLLLTPVPTTISWYMKRLGVVNPHHEIGWPWVYSLKLDFAVRLPRNKPRPSYYSNGYFWADVGVSLFIIVACGFFFAWLWRRCGHRPRASLRGLMISVAVIAAVCAWWFSNVHRFRHVMQIVMDPRRTFDATQQSFDDWQYCGPQWLRRFVTDEHLTIFQLPTALIVKCKSDSSDAIVHDITTTMAELPHITRLCISDCRTPVLRPLNLSKALNQIEELRIGNWPALSDDLAWIGAIPRLRRLEIFNEIWVYAGEVGDGLKSLCACSTLESLSLRATPFTDEDFKELPLLPHLEDLEVWRTSLTRAVIERITNLPALESLRLEGSILTEDDVERLLALPGAEGRVGFSASELVTRIAATAQKSTLR